MTAKIAFCEAIRRFTPIWAKPPNGPLVGLTPVASLEGGLELMAYATGLSPEPINLGWS